MQRMHHVLRLLSEHSSLHSQLCRNVRSQNRNHICHPLYRRLGFEMG